MKLLILGDAEQAENLKHSLLEFAENDDINVTIGLPSWTPGQEPGHDVRLVLLKEPTLSNVAKYIDENGHVILVTDSLSDDYPGIESSGVYDVRSPGDVRGILFSIRTLYTGHGLLQTTGEDLREIYISHLARKLIPALAHEVNNPLTAIVNYSVLIGRRSGDQRVEQMLGSIREQTDSIAESVNLLSSFARDNDDTAGALLQEAYPSVYSMLRPILVRRRIQVESSIDGIPELAPGLTDLKIVLFAGMLKSVPRLESAEQKERIIYVEAVPDQESPKFIELIIRDNGPQEAPVQRTEGKPLGLRKWPDFYALGIELLRLLVQRAGGSVNAKGTDGQIALRISLPLLLK